MLLEIPVIVSRKTLPVESVHPSLPRRTAPTKIAWPPTMGTRDLSMRLTTPCRSNSLSIQFHSSPDHLSREPIPGKHMIPSEPIWRKSREDYQKGDRLRLHHDTTTTTRPNNRTCEVTEP